MADCLEAGTRLSGVILPGKWGRHRRCRTSRHITPHLLDEYSVPSLQTLQMDDNLSRTKF